MSDTTRQSAVEDEPGQSAPMDSPPPQLTADETADSVGMELPRLSKSAPGSAAGIDYHELAHLPSTPQGSRITCIDYAPDRYKMEEIEDLEDFIVHHRPDWSLVRWINVDGITDMTVIQALAEKYEIHPLAVEDLLHVHQRPKVDTYDSDTTSPRARLVLFVRMIMMVDGKLHNEQITMVLGHKTIITFQETRGDVWDPIRDRIKRSGSRLRSADASFLVYALLDAIIDHCFPILDIYSDRLHELEESVFEHPETPVVQRIHQFNRDLMLLRRQMWPMRDVVLHLQRETHECMSENSRVYLRDVYDHIVQIIDMIETYREIAASMSETHATAMGNRLNEVMKVLTIVTTIFVPLSFLAGVWGMNFKEMPEMHGEGAYPWAYPIGFWSLCLVIAGGLLWFFRRRHWL